MTCDFWAENAEKSYKVNKQQQIPCGDNNKKGKGEAKAKTTATAPADFSAALLTIRL